MENISATLFRLIQSVVDDAPLPIGLYQGADFKIILANKCMIETYGKGDDVIGMSYMDLPPELMGQGIFAQLQSVLETGEPISAKNQKGEIAINGSLAVDVTHLSTARKQVANAEEKFALRYNLQISVFLRSI